MTNESRRKQSDQKSQVKLIRWSLGMASTEYGVSGRTVATRVKGAGILPGDDGLFSTMDIHRAIFGDYEYERTRKMKAEADRAEMDTAERRGELIDKARLTKWNENRTSAIRQIIMASPLPEASKTAILSELVRVHS